MKKQYEEIRKKHDLPSYEELNKDFEIYSISKEDDIIREILKKMSNTIDFYINMLEDIIQPDSRFYTLKESNIVDKNLRIEVNKTYNKLMFLNRTNIELHLDYEEEKATQLIKNLFVEWQTIKKELIPVVKTLKESWLKNAEIKPERGYFG
ncbi:hypothetical protein KO361_01340 [Candidatus Woesearchaeota archaeon]|nr:hypothetical protein [Candidatus Woesearchaeota archaeon]